MQKQHIINVLILLSLLFFSNSQLIIINPENLSSKFPDKTIEIETAKIGKSTYDFYSRGKLYLPNDATIPSTQLDACKPITNLNINEANFSENFKILLVYRGGCSFVHKARIAQNAHYSMIIIINNMNTDIKNVIMNDDGTGNDIKIPIVMISKKNGDILVDYIKQNSNEKIFVEINFIKKSSEKVDFKLFFSSSEKRAYTLINNLKQYLYKFGDQVTFTPIYVAHPDPSYDKNFPKHTKNCLSKGKYCYFPKETTITQDGIKILMEDLRQKCFFQLKKNSINSYYNYLNIFYYKCINDGIDNFNEVCSQKVMENLGYPGDILTECIANSFGVNNLNGPFLDNENSIFENEYKEIINYKLTSFPAVTINKNPLNGIIKESKIIIEICNIVKIKPDFCSFLTGETDEHILLVKKRKSLVYSLIIILIVINVFIFFVCRKYILQRIKEKIDQGGIDIDGRIKNIIGNYFSLTTVNNDYTIMKNPKNSSIELSNQSGKVVDIAIGSGN